MLRELVNIGNKIEVKKLDLNGELIKSSKTYVSQMVDYKDDGKIIVATPIRNAMIVTLEREGDYRLYFYTIRGLYQCDCKVIMNYREKKMVLTLVEPTSKLKKIQRRQYYRLECVHEIVYRLIREEEIKLEEKLLIGKFKNTDEKLEIRKKLSHMGNNWTKAVITDLSGGGCRFNSQEELKSGDKVRIKLDFIIKNELKKLDIIADIIKSQKVISRTGVYEHRAEFYNIIKKDREDLIKYIFEQERRLRKNEKK